MQKILLPNAYINALMHELSLVGRTHRDPFYFEYLDEKYYIAQYSKNASRYGLPKTALLQHISSGKYIEIKGYDFFDLVPLGKIRQEKQDGLFVDRFVESPEVIKLHKRLLKLLKKHKLTNDGYVLIKDNNKKKGAAEIKNRVKAEIGERKV